MNPKRRASKHVRVSVELFDWLADLAAGYGVSKRDAVDALIEQFKTQSERSRSKNHRPVADMIFSSWIDRYKIKQRVSKANEKGRSRMGAKPQPDAATEMPDVPDFMK